MELENIMLSKISQVAKDNTFVLTFKWNLMKKTNKQNRTRGIETRNRLTGTRGGGGEEKGGKKGKSIVKE